MKKLWFFGVAGFLSLGCLALAQSNSMKEKPLAAHEENAGPSVTAHAMEKGANIYGYLDYSDKPGFNQGYGMYTLSEDGYSLLWNDPLYKLVNVKANNGWYENGKICGLVPKFQISTIIGYWKYEIDFESGELLSYSELNMSSAPMVFFHSMLNPEDGLVYGYAYNLDDGGEVWWGTVDFENPWNADPIRHVGNKAMCYSICYNPEDGYYYGINGYQQFVRVSLDGSQTFIADVVDAEKCNSYLTGMVWNPVEKVFYWNCTYKGDWNYASMLYRITPEGEFTLVSDYSYLETFPYFVTTDEYSISDKPKRPEIESIDFENADLSGSVSFLMPSEYINGDPLPGKFEYTTLLDQEVYETGTASPGETVKTDYMVSESGFHTFGVYVTVDGLKSSAASSIKYVGYDIPAAPSNVILTVTEVTWDPVIKGINNAYLNPEEIEYKVYLNDEYLGTTSETRYQVLLPLDSTLASYKASIVAVNHGLESEPGESNSVVQGSAYTPPIFFQPTEEEFSLMTTVDVNENITYGWIWDTQNNIPYVRCGFTYDPDQPMDSYLFLPPIYIEDASQYYDFSFLCGRRGTQYLEEYVEVIYATSPDPADYVGTIIPSYKPLAVPTLGTWDKVEGVWNVPYSGEFYIGIHAISKGDMFGLYARDFSLKASEISGDSPGYVEDITAVRAPEGELKATVTFNLPLVTLDGETLNPDVNLTAMVNVQGLNNVYTAEGKPGDKVSVDVSTQQGTNIIEISVTDGNYGGPKTFVNVYTGVDLPDCPSSMTLIENPDMMSAELSWTPVTTAEEKGGYVDPAGITYTVALYVDLGIAAYWDPVAEGITGTSYTFRLEDGAVQDNYIIGVLAVNAAGESNNAAARAAYLGTPYALPMSDSLVTGDESFTIGPWFMYSAINYEPYNADWIITTMYQFDDINYDGPDYQVFAALSLDGKPCKGAMGLPRFSTKGEKNVAVSVDIVMAPYAPPVKIYAQKYGSSDLVLLGEWTPDDLDDVTIKPFTVMLPEQFENQDWVQVYVVPDFIDGTELFGMCGVNVVNAEAGILTMSADSLIMGGKGSIIVRGFEDREITLYNLDGKKVAQKTAESDNEIFYVDKGIYIVRAGDSSAKIVVK